MCNITLILYRVLAKRLEDLEKKIKTINQAEAIMSPSLVLLNECSNTSDETDFETSSIDG